MLQAIVIFIDSSSSCSPRNKMSQHPGSWFLEKLQRHPGGPTQRGHGHRSRTQILLPRLPALDRRKGEEILGKK